MSFKDKTDLEDFEWTVDKEVDLLYALLDIKPIGSDRNFCMAIVVEKLSNMQKPQIPVDQIWKQLNAWYDMETLNKRHTLKLNTDEFALPPNIMVRVNSKTTESEESSKSNLLRSGGKTKAEVKDANMKTSNYKRDDKPSKSTHRRDSLSKDNSIKHTPISKSTIKLDFDKRNSGNKGRPRKNSEVGSSSSFSASRTTRPTRGSLKPDDSTPTRSKSPNIKRRRTRTDALD